MHETRIQNIEITFFGRHTFKISPCFPPQMTASHSDAKSKMLIFLYMMSGSSGVVMPCPTLVFSSPKNVLSLRPSVNTFFWIARYDSFGASFECNHLIILNSPQGVYSIFGLTIVLTIVLVFLCEEGPGSASVGCVVLVSDCSFSLFPSDFLSFLSFGFAPLFLSLFLALSFPMVLFYCTKSPKREFARLFSVGKGRC